ncbi:beta-glucosidase BglX [Labilibacter sediminis]|nr:beta-glucosidase BglX [Labilibacter sediminis]
MKFNQISIFLFIGLLISSSSIAQSRAELKKELESKEVKPVVYWTDKQINQKVDSVLGLMTLDEKIGQMYEVTGAGGNISELGDVLDVNDPNYYRKKGWVGMSLGASGALTCYEAQKSAIEDTRLGIPLHFNVDVIHGFKTIFPVNLGLSATWDPQLVEKAAHISAVEATVSGVTINNAPMIDVCRDPRWGRITEGVGEDPYLASVMAKAFVKGFQGDNLADKNTFMACAKHFVGYGAAEGGRDYNTIEVSERTLRQTYLPPFKAAVDAGVGSIMPAFNIVDGVACSGNKWLMKDVAREEWGFEGIFLSDFNAVHEIMNHGNAANEQEAAKLALDATMDIEMSSQVYIMNLKKMVQEDIVSEKQIDEAVKRILKSKFQVGLFDDPYRYIDIKGEERLHCSPEHLQAAREIAAKSIVLLKNDPIDDAQMPLLPLRDDYKSVALIGPFAKTRNLQGAWAWGKMNKMVTVKKGFENRLGDKVDLKVVEGVHSRTQKATGIEEAVEAAKASEIIVLCLGEPQTMSGEAKSRAELDLPGDQKKLAEEILKLGKPTVLVIFSGRPLVLTWYHEHFPTILNAWFPGTEAGNALADVLWGDVNPSAKLTSSFPYHVGQLPIYYNHLLTGRPASKVLGNKNFISKYLDVPNEPLYPFGHGLSYTTYEYSNLTLSSDRLKKGGELEVSLKVTNTGTRAGEEIVQLYTRDMVGSVSRPVKELKGFQKIKLAAGESKKVVFTLTEEDLKFWTYNMQYESEPGQFKVFVGGSSADCLEKEFELIK